MKTEKRLSDVTRANSANKANKFADSLMPAAPKPRVEQPVEVEPSAAATTVEVVNQQPPEPVVQEKAKTDNVVENLTFVPAPPKPEKAKKSGGFTVAEIINMPVKEGEVYNKMVRVTDEQHELLRLIGFQSRKPMNIIVHNLIALLEQAYQKEAKGGQVDV